MTSTSPTVRRTTVLAAMLALALVGPLGGAALDAYDDGPMLLGGVGYAALVALVATALGMRRPSDRDVANFFVDARLTPTVGNDPVVRRYLARTRRWRAYGVVGSLSAMQVVVMAAPDTSFNMVAGLFAGWFVGGIVAEVPVGRRTPPGVRVATLEPRTLGRYLSSGVSGWLAGWAVTAALLIGWYARVASPLGTRRVVLVSGALLGLALVSLWSMREIVRRPQPLAAPDIVAADDATRVAAVRRIAGGWAVLQCIAVIVVGAWLTNLDDPGGATDLALALVTLGYVGVLGSWLFVPRIVSPPRPRGGGVVVS